MKLKEKTKITQRSLTPAQKRKVIDKWIEKNGGATFDLKDKQIIFHDGAGFWVKKEIKYLPRHRWKPITEGKWKGGAKLIDIKGPKVKYEFYSCYYSFEDLDETINYLRRIKKMLNDLGYKTDYRFQNSKGGKKK